MPDASTVVVSCPRQDYSASVIARAVEDCDAHLLNLNLLAEESDYGEVLVALRIDLRNPMPAVRSLQRFGYEPVDVEAPDALDTDAGAETARSRANELIRYLEI